MTHIPNSCVTSSNGTGQNTPPSGTLRRSPKSQYESKTQRKLAFARHCYHATDQLVSELVFLQRPTERFYQDQQFTITYEKSILADLCIYMGARDSAYIANYIINVQQLMSDRETWIETVQKYFRV